MLSVQKPKSVGRMVRTMKGKFYYYFLRLYFASIRPLGVEPRIPFFVRLPLSYRGKNFDFFVNHRLDFCILQDTFVTEEYILEACNAPKNIFDLGSNIGGTVVFFKLWYPDAKIYAFEPDERNLVSLRKNISQFGDSVVLIPKAVVGEPKEMITFFQSTEYHWSSSTIFRDMQSKIVDVPAVTICNAMVEFGIDRLSICKFDIEGAEYDVFTHLPQSVAIDWLIGEVHPHVTHTSVGEFQELLKRFKYVETRPGCVLVYNSCAL